MTTFFNRLPYDILRLVFGFLDVQTLLNAALASHALNEIASLSLYTSIILNPDAQSGAWYRSHPNYQDRRNPIIALERKPHLREVVRSVVLCSSADPWGGDQTTDADVEYYFQALLRLPAVACLTIRYCSSDSEKRWIAKLLPQLDTLRTLNIENYERHAEDFDFSLPESCNIHAYLTDDTLSRLSSASTAPRVRSLIADGYSCDLTPQQLSMALAPFTRLTKFSQDGYESLTPSEICLVVHGIPSLREGSFACSVQSEDISLTPTGVKHLTDLRIRFRCVESQNQAKILQQLVKCIAGSSQLRRLELVATGRKPKVLGGDLVLNHILPVHGETLQKLKIPNLHPSNGVLKRTILRCKQLRALWLGISQNMKAQLPILLAASTSLEKIRIYAKGKWDLIYVEALFHQTCQSLSVFKVCATSGYQRRKSVWKSQWEYDSLLKQPVRKVLGPTAIQYP